MLINRANPFVFEENDDKGANNVVINGMRKELEKAQADAKKAADKVAELEASNKDAQEKLKEIERAKLDENQRLKAEHDDLQAKFVELQSKTSNIESLSAEKDQLSVFIGSLYESQINGLPENIRAQVKQLTEVAGSPALSMEKLKNASELIKALGGDSISQGLFTQPGGTGPDKTNDPEKKVDPKNVSWSQGLRSIEEMKAEREKIVGPNR